MASRILALIIWAAVAASLAFWGLRWLAQPTAVPPNASAVSLDNAGKGDPRKLLAGPAKTSGPAAPDNGQNAMLAGRIKLIGVVAPKHPEDQGGVALISVDNNPARAIRVGGVVDGQNVLRSLTQHGAEIGPAEGPTALTLELPVLPAPATGVIPPIGGLIAASGTPQPGGSHVPLPNGVQPPPQPGEAMPGQTGGMRRPQQN